MQNSIYEEIPFDNAFFPIRIFTSSMSPQKIPSAPLKWHEQLELLYFRKGGAIVECGTEQFLAEDEDIFIINPCEIHTVYYGNGSPVYDCIMIDPKLYFSTEKDICELKYLAPMANKQVCFQNLIRGNCQITLLLKAILSECKDMAFAYELAVKGNILNLLVCLFRDEVKSIQSQRQKQLNIWRYERMEAVFQHIEAHYETQIKLETLAKLCNITLSHFCRMFKTVTGKTAMQYINEYRIAKAEVLLKTTDMSVSDIAVKVGFTDNCYFSRCFKHLRNITPLSLRLSATKNTE